MRRHRRAKAVHRAKAERLPMVPSERAAKEEPPERAARVDRSPVVEQWEAAAQSARREWSEPPGLRGRRALIRAVAPLVRMPPMRQAEARAARDRMQATRSAMSRPMETPASR